MPKMYDWRVYALQTFGNYMEFTPEGTVFEQNKDLDL